MHGDNRDRNPVEEFVRHQTAVNRALENFMAHASWVDRDIHDCNDDILQLLKRIDTAVQAGLKTQVSFAAYMRQNNKLSLCNTAYTRKCWTGATSYTDKTKCEAVRICDSTILANAGGDKSLRECKNCKNLLKQKWKRKVY